MSSVAERYGPVVAIAAESLVNAQDAERTPFDGSGWPVAQIVTAEYPRLGSPRQ